MMRTRIGLVICVIMVLGIVAGERLFNRLRGQDAPKKVEAEKKDPGSIPLPSVPPLPPQPAKTPDAKPMETPKPASIEFPALPAPKAEEPKEPGRFEVQGFPKQAFEPPTGEPIKPVQAETKAEKDRIVLPPLNPTTPAPKVIAEPLKIPPTTTKPDPLPPPANDIPPVTAAKPAPPTVPMPPTGVAEQIAKLKNSPWSLRIDIVDGQTVLTATVSQKHSFKVVCQTLELNTGKDMLKAIGKVKIAGDMMSGQCETLGIVLTDDRLVLEGGAEVRIQKNIAQVSSTPASSFELKGETLNLRISDLQAGKYIQTNFRDQSTRSDSTPRPLGTAQMMTPPSVMTPLNKTSNGKAPQWSAWGTLRRLNEKASAVGEPVWRLEDARGVTILLLVARDGGTLSQYEGQRISVFGPTETIAGESMLRVSHVALP